jgi:hypothetical protein
VGRKTSRLDLSTRKISPHGNGGKRGRESLERQSSCDDFEALRTPSVQSHGGSLMKDTDPIHDLSRIHPSASCETDSESGAKVFSLHRIMEAMSPLDCSFTAEHQTEVESCIFVQPDTKRASIRNSNLTEDIIALANTEHQHVTSPVVCKRLRVYELKIPGILEGDNLSTGGVPSTPQIASTASAEETISISALRSQASRAGDRSTGRGRGRECALTMEATNAQDDDVRQIDLDPKKKEFEEIMSELVRRKSSTPKETVTVDGVEYPVRVGSAADAFLMVDYLFSPPYDREVFCCAYVHNAMKTAIGKVSTAGTVEHRCTLSVALLATSFRFLPPALPITIPISRKCKQSHRAANQHRQCQYQQQ